MEETMATDDGVADYDREFLPEHDKVLLNVLTGGYGRRTPKRIAEDIRIVREPEDGNWWAIHKLDHDEETATTVDILHVGAFRSVLALKNRLSKYTEAGLWSHVEGSEKDDVDEEPEMRWVQ
ncbi:hypothetical protein [Halobaculum sp. D14]|uniref:hypothetical protein n=1 Tax=Halobaculum sp. D14 TaxID=3421642 RepID=UPI003EBE1D36